jgi:hypothetical protein
MDGPGERNRGAGRENRQHQRQRDKFPHLSSLSRHRSERVYVEIGWSLCSAQNGMLHCNNIVGRGRNLSSFRNNRFANRAALIRAAALHPAGAICRRTAPTCSTPASPAWHRRGLRAEVEIQVLWALILAAGKVQRGSPAASPCRLMIRY